jgi:hypothetical protein
MACGISSVLAITGFAVFYASGHDKVRYGSLFLSVPGAYGVSPSLSAWTSDNSAPHMRKATALALGSMVANSGGLFCVWASLFLPFSIRKITRSDLKVFFYAASIMWWFLDLHIGAQAKIQSPNCNQPIFVSQKFSSHSIPINPSVHAKPTDKPWVFEQTEPG